MDRFEQFATQLQARIPQLEMRRNEPMAKHTSFRIGGPAALMVFPTSKQMLRELLQFAFQVGIKPDILGAGTNVLCADEGRDALVICLRDCFSGIIREEGDRLRVLAGTTMAKTAVAAQSQGLSGLEFAHGIPGTVGGGVYMNAGAYHGEICQVAEETTVFLPDGTEQVFRGEEQRFSYRHSAFQGLDCVIVETLFHLTPADPDEIRKKMTELAVKRKTSQPLDMPSAGSTFQRPVGGYAAALIEQAGLKGFQHGNAAVSGKHAGFVVNLGGASCKEVLELMEMVQNKVEEKTGIRLEPEVKRL